MKRVQQAPARGWNEMSEAERRERKAHIRRTQELTFRTSSSLTRAASSWQPLPAPQAQSPAQAPVQAPAQRGPAHPLIRQLQTLKATTGLSALLLLGTAAAQGGGVQAAAEVQPENDSANTSASGASLPTELASTDTTISTTDTDAPTDAPTDTNSTDTNSTDTNDSGTGTPGASPALTPSTPSSAPVSSPLPLPVPPSPLPATQSAPLQPAPISPVQLIAPVLPQPQAQPAAPSTPAPVGNPDGTISLPSLEQPAPDEQAAPSVPHGVDLTLTVPVNASQTVLVQRLPAGVSYVPGSVTLGGQGVPEPRVLGNTLYFVFSGAASGKLHYSVTAPEGPLTLTLSGLGVRYPQGQTEVLQGALSFEEAGRAAPLAVAAPTERVGVIRTPLDNAELRGSHSVNVTVDVPAGVSPAGVLSVNGAVVPRTRVGQTLTYADGHTRLVYIAVPLVSGVNELSALGDKVLVRTGAPAARVLVVPAKTNVADGSTPLDFVLDVRDAAGNATDLPGVAVSVVGDELLEASRDAVTGNVTTSGTIIPITAGVGHLRLRPLSTPGVVTLIFDVNGHQQQERFSVGGDQGRFAVARGGLSLSGGELGGSAAGTLETPLLGGKLYAAANSAGVNAQPLPYARSTTYGDASSSSQPLSAIGDFAARLELPALHAEYLQDAAYDPIFGVHTGADGLNVETRGERRYGASATVLPGDLKTVTLTPNGTRLLQLPDTTAVANSETLELVLSVNSVEVSRRTLARNSDYVLGGGGLIEFPAPLLPVTSLGQAVSVVAHYRSGAGGDNSYTFGAHVSQDFRLPALGDAIGTASAGFISQDGVLAVGAHALLVGPTVAADVLAGYSSGVLLQGSALYKAGPVSAAIIARSQDASYLGPQGGAPGSALSATATYQLNAQFGVKVAAQYASGPVSTTVSGVTTTTDTVSAAAIGAGLTYDRLGQSDALHAELLARRNFLDGGLFGASATLGYTTPTNSILVNQVQDFGGGQSVTTLSAGRKLSETLRLGVTAVHDWVAGTTTAGLALTGTHAGMTYVAGYDLPTTGTSIGSARLAASTSVALRPGLSADAAASAYTQEGVPGVSVGGTLRYARDTVQASVGSDLAVSGGAATLDVKSALNFAVSSRLTLALDGLSQFGDASVTGSRYGVSLAWRGEHNDAIGYLRFRSGAFGEDRVTGELDFTQTPDMGQRRDRSGQPIARSYQPLELRESVDAAYPLTGVAPTVLGQVGARYWVSDRFALGAVGGALWQQGSPLGTRLGLEATVSPLTGLGITAGYNFTGFTNDLGRQSTRPGFYLQLDLLLDEARK